jgi:hypothetical protein
MMKVYLMLSYAGWAWTLLFFAALVVVGLWRRRQAARPGG